MSMPNKKDKPNSFEQKGDYCIPFDDKTPMKFTYGPKYDKPLNLDDLNAMEDKAGTHSRYVGLGSALDKRTSCRKRTPSTENPVDMMY